MLLRAALVPPAEAMAQLWAATRSLRGLPGVTTVPQGQLDIPITAFGNLLPDDCARLARALRTAVEGADAPVVSCQAVRLGDDGTIAVGLDGDVDPLADLARFVPEAAEKLRLFVDRRRFRPAIALGTVASGSSPTLLEPALAPLAGWRGDPWAVPGLSLIRTRWTGGESRSEVYDLIAFG